jgi:hypothetical protein
MKLVKFADLHSWERWRLSVTSQQLLVTSVGYNKQKNNVIEVYDVDGKLVHRVELLNDVISCRVEHAVQTSRDTFYVCGEWLPSDYEKIENVLPSLKVSK